MTCDLELNRSSRLLRLELSIAVFSMLAGFSFAGPPDGALTGTAPLTLKGDLSFQVLDGVDALLLKRTEDSVTSRESMWSRDYSSFEAYTKSVSANRERFRLYCGVVDERLPFTDLQLVGSLHTPALVAETNAVRVFAVEWPVFANVSAEGFLLEPKNQVRAQVVAVPDADWTPEKLAGIGAAVHGEPGFALKLAEAGCRVLIPTIIDRAATWSGNPRVRMTNQTHREFIYRQAYFLGRHIIGYEVQKILAAVDYFSLPASNPNGPLPIGVAGYGEGGLLALYSAAIDSRIGATLVSGYFQQREELWKEPVYRNVWGLLQEFGDAGIASLIAPRSLVIEASEGPIVEGPPPRIEGRDDAASGTLASPPLESVTAEFSKARAHFQRLGVEDRIRLIADSTGAGPPFGPSAAAVFTADLLGETPQWTETPKSLADRREGFEPSARMRRQVSQLVDFTQHLMRQSVLDRREFWKKADDTSVQRWELSTRFYRDYFFREMVGVLPAVTADPSPRTRLLYETAKWKGYEVVLDTWPGVITYGILLVPRDLQPNERRPVVVAQHGRAGRPQDVCNPNEDTPAYHSFGARLADQGFVVFAPQNLYLGEERYRELQRKAMPLKLTIFAPMIRQHEQVLRWLSSLPFVDAGRIGFYGLSYGGKSAMFIPAVVKGYALSICSGDFNEEVWKHVTVDVGYSFLLTKEHEHTEFGFGQKFNYGELAGLIAPRPFMVERGHSDGVGEDEWVAFEYAKVRRLYDKLGIGDRTRIEYFNGPHEIHGVGTFDFLHKYLVWAKH